ncbi:alpha/beta hydrolase [Bdellovibrio sp. HCB288]|uniref:alpha/beta hydrolase n=1 Tax=Bdellovibrio sp. HCB288 TaxID=3394355 RepID=UPI0039B50C28
MGNSNGKTVVLIHGAWMTPISWDGFKKYFEEQGFNVITPTWPLMDKSIEELRAHPDSEFGALSFKKIADHLEGIIRALPEPPLLVGHSMGGLLVQLLLDRGLGSAGICIDPAPIAGVIPDTRSLTSALPGLLRFAGWRKPYILTKEAFDKNFANTAPAEQRDADYKKFVVPAPGKIFFQAATGIGTHVDVKHRKQPLLIIAGEDDRTTAPAMVEANYRKQAKSPSRTDFKSFAGVSHYLIAEPGWEKVADASVKWAQDVMR